jgi:hypothetical protein
MSSYTVEENKYVHTCDMIGLSSDTTYYFNTEVSYTLNNLYHSKSNLFVERIPSITRKRNSKHFPPIKMKFIFLMEVTMD